MTAVYALALVFGMLAGIAWIIGAAIGSSVAGWEWVDLDRRFRAPGRAVVAGVWAFGLAGMSATFAGWPTPIAAAAALLGAVFGVWSAWLLRSGGVVADR